MSLEALPFVRHIVYNVAHQICNGYYYRKILFHRYIYRELARGGGGALKKIGEKLRKGVTLG